MISCWIETPLYPEDSSLEPAFIVMAAQMPHKGCICSFQESPEPRYFLGTPTLGLVEPLYPPMEGLLGKGRYTQEGGAMSEHQPAWLSGSLPGQQAGRSLGCNPSPGDSGCREDMLWLWPRHSFPQSLSRPRFAYPYSEHLQVTLSRILWF